jgi:AcrR family transcriptional regulator
MTEKQKKTHRQIQKEDTRRIILDSAYNLFAEKGYAKTTMRSLAKKAGVGLGTISKHFPDKPSLLAAAFQEDLSQIIQDSFVSLPAAGLINQLLHIVESIYTFYAARPDVSRALIKEILFLDGAYGKALDAQVYELLGKIEKLIENAIANGELEPEINIETGAQAFWSFYFMVLIVGLKEPVFDKDRQLKILETLLVQHFYGRRD